MKRVILYLFLLLFLSGCYETKKQAAINRKGLMMMEQREYSRNKGVYKPSKTLKALEKNKKLRK